MKARSLWIAGAAMLAGLLALRDAIHDDPAIERALATAPPRDAAVVVPPPAVIRHAAIATTPPAPAAPVVRSETADSCGDTPEPVVPADYESLEVAGITIAWDPAPLRSPYDAPLRPSLLAHAVAGLLEEAAAATGTTPRATLLVIVDPSHDALRTRAHAPAWAGGLYDGSVRVPALPSADLGVPIATLRHEIMHAQLHAMVGCMPAWFDEGIAYWFGDAPPLHEWIALLRGAELRDPGILISPFADELDDRRVGEMYAQSAAMAMTVADDIGGAVRALAAAPDRRHLWDRADGAILDTIARRLFDIPRGRALDAVLAGPICCTGLSHLGDAHCRVPGVVKERASWLDSSLRPAARCQTSW